MKRPFLLLSAVAISFACSLSFAREEPVSSHRVDDPLNAGFKYFSELAKLVERSDRITLYEGLPHQMWEDDSFQRELKRKKTVKFGGYPFYAETLPISKVHAEKVRKTYIKPGNLAPFAGEKACGGFHPDYCIAFSGKGGTVYVLTCFGCGEAITISGKKTMRTEMGKAGQVFEPLLKKYRKNRPKEAR